MLERDVVRNNLNRLIEATGNKLLTYSIITNIPLVELRDKLEGRGDFTVSQVGILARALGHPAGSLFMDVESKEPRPCADPVCVNDEHVYEGGVQIDVCRLTPIGGEGFRVNGHREGDGSWTAWVDAEDIEDGAEGISQVRDMLLSFEMMHAKCEKLNGRKIERHTEPGQPAAEELAGVGL